MNQKVKKREASGASPAIQYTKHVKMLDSSCAAPRRGAASVAGQHFSETVSHPVGWLMSTSLNIQSQDGSRTGCPTSSFEHRSFCRDCRIVQVMTV